jgi:hypothetical protein
MVLGEFNLLDGEYSFGREERLQGFICHMYIKRNHGHRFPAPLATAQVKCADVDPLSAENCPDATDHTRNISIVHHEHVAMRDCLNAKVINLRDAAFAFHGGDSKHSA